MGEVLEIQTTVSKNMETADDKARYDNACKKLLSEKMILAWIMKSCMEEYRDFDVKEIAEKYIEGVPEVSSKTVYPDDTGGGSMVSGTGVEDTTMTESTITFDIRFNAIVPKSGEIISLIINVEAQDDFYPGYPLIKRVVYYCSRMISSQYGTVFTNSHYEKIKKVYSIWICMDPPRSRENTITKYSWTEENLIGEVREKVADYDLMTAVMICLGDADTGDEGILRLLDILLSPDMEVSKKRKIMQEDFDIPMTQKIERTVGEMGNLGQGVEDRTILKSIINLMDTMKWTVEQAMNALKIPEQDQAKFRRMIQK